MTKSRILEVCGQVPTKGVVTPVPRKKTVKAKTKKKKKQTKLFIKKPRGVPPSRIGSKRYQLTPKEGEAGIKMFVSFPNESIDTECEIPGSRRRTPEELKRVLEDVRRRREKLNALT